MSRWFGILVLGLGACNADSDGDGLSNKDEKAWESDPKVADSDGDGLSDGDEIAAGTDPTVADTDGDGALDNDEILVGLNPLDPNSHPYIGGWPNQTPAEKEAVAESGRSGAVVEVGKLFKRFSMKDQFGDTVDLYDFAHQGKPIIIDVSAEWCPPCRAMAAWLDGDGNPPAGMGPEIPEAVDNGDVYWLTVLGEDNDGQLTSPKVLKSWYKEFKNPHVPVLGDPVHYLDGDGKGSLVAYIELAHWPTLFLLDEDMVVQSIDDYSGIQTVCEEL